MMESKIFSVRLNKDEIINVIKSGFIFLFIISMLGFFIIVMPLSVLSTENFKIAWSVLMHAIGITLSISGAFYLLPLFLKNEESDILSIITFLCALLFLSLYFCLLILQLIPIYLFVPRYYIIIMFGVIILYQYYSTTYKYIEYLNRSFEFVENYFLLIASICVIRILKNFQNIISYISNNAFSLSSELISYILTTLLLFILIPISIKYIYKTKHNDKTDFILYSSKLIVILLILQIMNYIAFKNIIFSYFGLIALLILIFNTSRMPNQKKSSKLFFLGIIIYFISVLLDMIYPELLDIMVSGFKFDYILNIVAIIVSIIALLNGKKYLFIKHKKVSKIDIDQAIDELLNKNGFNLKFINSSVRISTVVGRFLKLKYISSKLYKNINIKQKELYNYFRLYLYCAEFNKKRKVYIERKKYEGILYRRLIDTEQDFVEFIKDNFPKQISSLSLYRAYSNNDLILYYLKNKKLLKSIKSQSLSDKLKKCFSIFVTFLIIISFGLSTVPPEGISEIFKIIPAAKKIILSNVIRVKFQFVDSSQVYQNSEWRNYYINNTFNWAMDAFKSSKRKKNDLKKICNRLIKILSHCNKDEYLYNRISYEIAIVYKYGLSNFEKAIIYFEKAISIKDKGVFFFDNALYNLAKCNIRLKAHVKAKTILNEYKNNWKMVESQILLSILNIYNSNYTEAKNILDKMQLKNKNNIQIESLLLICESFIDKNNQSKLIDRMKVLSENRNLDNFDYENILLNNRLGLISYKDSNYFLSGEYLYKSLSRLILSNANCIAEKDLLILADILILSAEKVFNKNKKDYRINLWKSVAYHIKKDKIRSIKYFQKHLKVSPKNFEKEFTKYFFYNVFKKP